MPKLGLGLSLPQTLAAGGFTPKKLSGLSLWLKADAGVSKLSLNYASQIIISGTSTPNFNGTYTAIGTPTSTNGVVDSYSFSAPSGRQMNWSSGEGQYQLFLSGSGYGGFGSSDGITWNPLEQYISSITITGFTGAYTSANVTYTATSPNSGRWENANGYHILDDGFVYDADDIDIAYNTNDFVGAWTLTNGAGSPTSTKVILPDGSISGSVTTSTVISDNVTVWADQSGNGNNASSSDGTRPTLVSNTLNSKPVLRFDGTGQQMALTSSIGGTEYTIVIVCKNNDNELGSMFLWTTDENYGLYIGVLTDENFNEDARNKFLLSEADAGGGGEGSVLAWSSASANNNFFIGTATQNGGGKAYLNGAGGTNSLGTFSASNLFNLVGGYEFGYELDGDVAEIIAYNRVLTTPERQQVEAYLNTKYAIY